ncbi:YdeI/OmpD-associated family protein [Winogradskya consettensis]|uniref:YdeI/OmpD-associated family protein n=1 Tax=Winogradskya consettensis TaxID=113560 RepID=UPI002453A5E3|nr:YdeI/OmpD-associated family protein [Actinoplanes consettensis]
MSGLEAVFFAKPASYRRAPVHRVTSAKRSETRDRRLTQLITDSAASRTVPPLTRR